MSQIANRYARALFELADERNNIDAWQEQMKKVKQIFVQNKEYLAFFAHYRIADVEKKEVLKNVFSEKLDKEVLHFLLLLVDKKRIKGILEITNAFNSLCNESKQIKEGIVYSVNELEEDQLQAIEASVGAKIGYRVSFVNRIDKDLISGVKVVVEDQVIDGSMKYRIQSLKAELLRESR